MNTAPAGAETGRDSVTGRFVAGNTAALQAPARAAIRRRVLSDLGTTEDALTATFSAIVDRFCEASQLAAAYFVALEHAGGPISTRGRQRSAVRGYLSALEVELRLAQLIGLERRTRPPGSLADYLARQPKDPA